MDSLMNNPLGMLISLWFFLVLVYMSIRIFRGKQFYKDGSSCKRGIFTGLFSDENAYYTECCKASEDFCKVFNPGSSS